MNDLLSVEKRLEFLRTQIRHYEYAYYVESNSEISDKEFDLLLEELIELERVHPKLVTEDSPTQRVGGIAASFETITHRVPMMSIENSYTFSEISNWLTRCEKQLHKSPFPVVAELKIDGVSGSFGYNNGKLINAATRGDGKTGDLITANARAIKSLPLSIASKHDMDIRGEIYTPRSVLIKLNSEREKDELEPFKNCRNLTSGTVKSLDPSVTAKRRLGVMVYGIAQGKDLGFDRHSEVMSFLSNQGFKVNHAWKICQNESEIKDFIDDIAAKIDSFDFDTDGVVIKIDDFSKQEELGYTAKAPRWVIAYKYPQKRAITKLKSVEWQVGRQQITPVAILDPVELGGTTVSRASLHNIDQIKEKDIRTGDFVVVEKAGYIIPYIVESLPEKRIGRESIIEIPQHCPSCQLPLSIKKSEDDGSTQIYCGNSSCKGVISRKILHFINQMEIENFGPQLIEKLLERKCVQKTEDILFLNELILSGVERIGSKSAQKLVKNIKKAAFKPLFRVISALGIPNVGIVISESIAKAFNQSFDSFLNSDEESLIKIEGIQKTVAGSILSYLKDEENITFLNALKDWWKGPSETIGTITVNNDFFKNKIFVITGEASLPRKEIEEIIKKNGGSVKSSVTAKTDYLVIGSNEPETYNSSKKTKALEHKVDIIDEHKILLMSEQ